MNCPNCNAELKKKKIDKFLIQYCDKCWNHISYDVECKDHNPIFVKFKFSNDSLHIRKQCQNCGKIDSKFYSKDVVPNWKSIPDANIELQKKFSYEGVHEIYSRYLKKKETVSKESNFEKFIVEHNDYLKTIEWQKKRLLVLKRDNFLCQACLMEKAKEVHHKSYRYWKNEPLFDLVAVCVKCHAEITSMNRSVLNYDFIISNSRENKFFCKKRILFYII
ncbi:hypothetical protein FE632_05055 [Elizabethkingia miricola]|jgi:5-methylcytosine-specific restriction endonuclease McrA|uniref:TFIIB-type zinc ribbon-containing protein n=1 Tax=Elizabethkingia miricola TaxID=172045 RepID=UPI000C14D24B|nr:zf-TFIIB domain-containing protein [Elizabethkingia miricola]PSL86940.1 hypothetical protein C7V10_18045 [Elizabethkingia miricola]QHQ86183.1 hypothetical protein FE632_05055 [Elizabethkingia miricola]WNG66145.1 zf-TFIIB domain-containing protein [Elizabethkingia miricola]